MKFSVTRTALTKFEGLMCITDGCQAIWEIVGIDKVDNVSCNRDN